MKIDKKVYSGRAAFIFALILAIPCLVYYSALHAEKDYWRLVELIKLEDKEGPFVAFDDFQEEFDGDCHEASLEYFNGNPELIRKIKADLGSGVLRWRLDSLSQRLLFVPEQRQEYAALFETYCEDVIDYVLDETKLDNPYEDIRTLIHEKPETPDSSGEVRAFVVHNLAQEYIATYVFTNKKGKKVQIELSGRLFLGDVGSYSTSIYLRDDGRFEFTRDNYTIWQNSAKNPYTALTVPVEETLHIALRDFTEQAIKEKIKRNSVKTLKGVERIAEDWMAVEEAIVGGVVYALLPGFLRKYANNVSDSLIKEDIQSKSKLRKYRHLKTGIEIIKDMGYQEIVEIYKDDPVRFKKLLMFH